MKLNIMYLPVDGEGFVGNAPAPLTGFFETNSLKNVERRYETHIRNTKKKNIMVTAWWVENN